MNLQEIVDLLRNAGLLLSAPDDDPVIGGLADDSRNITAGGLFLAVSGLSVDGHDFIHSAANSGAVAVIAEHAVACSIPLVRVSDSRAATELLAAEWYHHPARQLKIVGITGTNGKTTTSWIMQHLLSDDHNAGSLGTLGAFDGHGEPVSSTAGNMTTPGALDLQQTFRGLVDRGVDKVAMEASSHALHQKRLSSVRFVAGVFTNLTHEHLDYHTSLADYRDAKLVLADLVRGDGVLSVNADDPAWASLMSDGRAVSWGHATDAHLRVTDVHYLSAGSQFRITGRFGEADVELPLPGDINIANALAAAVVALHLGASLQEVALSLSSAPQVPGRMETLVRAPFHVLRDYAHTPDAVQRLLATVRAFTPGKVLLVFGCGGDRDRSKRPLMGAMASAGADSTILTSDNPRGEDPERIMDDIAGGMPKSSYQREADRHLAIATVLGAARPGDTVVLMGKGPETYQQIGDVKEPFDERSIVRGLMGA